MSKLDWSGRNEENEVCTLVQGRSGQTLTWAGSHTRSSWPWLLNVSTSATLAKG